MLKPIENGDYLHEKLSKYATIADYDIQNSAIVAVFVESVSPANFVAKFEFADLCNVAKKMAFNHNIKYPVRLIRDATPDDGCLYPKYEDTIKGGIKTDNRTIANISKPIDELKFIKVCILGECDEDMIKYLREDDNAMGLEEVFHNSGVFRRMV